MVISELITELRELMATYGDLEVIMDDDTMPSLSYDEDGDHPVLVID